MFDRFTDSLMYYAMSLNTGSLHGDIFLNTTISGLVEIPANILCVLFLNWRFSGRRWTCAISLILAGVSSFITMPLVLDKSEHVHGLTETVRGVGGWVS